MNYLMDVLGSFAIAGGIILMVVAFTLLMNDNSNKQLLSSMNQNSATASIEIIKYDFSKIGYRATSNKVLVAENSRIKYLSDFDNNGIIDTIEYYKSSTNLLTATKNPNDFYIYRKVNNTTQTISIATNFNLVYYDSLGSSISYSQLVNQNMRDKIKSIQVNLSLQSGEAIDNTYETTHLKTIIRPKNLNF